MDLDTVAAECDIALRGAHERGVPGLRLLAARGGDVVVDLAAGRLQSVDAADAPTPAEPVRADTAFDLASVTKLFTAALAVAVLTEAAETLDAPVARFLPRFADTPGLTVRHLLNHTAGFEPTWDGWRVESPRDEAWQAFRMLRPRTDPGIRHEYSCVGYIVAGELVSAVTGTRLDDAMRRYVLRPLGLTATGYGAAPENCAATELQREPPRGVVRGAVHDETAWRLGGITGNAGLFAPADDVLRFAEAIRSGALGAAATQELTLPHPGTRAPYGQAAGFRVGDRQSTSGLSPGTLSHTGFTGTWVAIDTDRDLTAVLLTNRVHPRRETEDPNRLRRQIANLLARLPRRRQ